LHRFLQRFSMRQTTQRDYHNPTDTYYNIQFSAVKIRLGCIPANVVSYTTVLFVSKASSAISIIGYQAVNFVCKLQQHFFVDNTEY